MRVYGSEDQEVLIISILEGSVLSGTLIPILSESSLGGVCY